MKSLFYSLVLCLSLLFCAHISNAAISCGIVVVNSAACIPFATGKDSVPSTLCCNGLQQLANSVKSVDDKKDICRCLKAAVKNIPGVDDKYLSQLPDACKITVGFPVSLNTNCEVIN